MEQYGISRTKVTERYEYKINIWMNRWMDG